MSIIEAMIKLAFEVGATILLAGGVLGYDIEKNKKRIAITVLVSAVTVAMVIVLVKTLLGLSTILYWLMVALAPIALFGKRAWGIVFTIVIAIDNIENIFRGLFLLIFHNCGEIFTLFSWGSVAGYIAALIIAVLMFKCFSSRRKQIHNIVVNKSQGFYFVMSILLFAVMYGFSERDKVDAEYVIIKGAQIFSNGATGVVLIVVIALCIGLIYQKRELKKINSFNKKCIAEQTEQYKLLNNAQQELRKFHHDSKAHLNAIQYLAQSGELEKIKNYVSKLAETQEVAKYIDTGNIIGDAVINQYYRICREIGMDVVVMGHFAESLNVDETDMCIILTNIISNAYEAAVKCVDEKILKVEITDYKENQFIRVINSVQKEVEVNDGKLCIERSSKIDGKTHGYGIANAIEAAERCSGSILWEKIKYKEKECILTEVRLNIE